MDTFDKYSRFTPLIVNHLLSTIVKDFKDLKDMTPQVFLFKNSSSDDFAIAPLDNSFIDIVPIKDWHAFLKGMFNVGLKNLAEGFIVVIPTESTDKDDCLLYTAFNTILQEGECFSHTLSDSQNIEVCRADCSSLDSGIQLLFNAEH